MRLSQEHDSSGLPATIGISSNRITYHPATRPSTVPIGRILTLSLSEETGTNDDPSLYGTTTYGDYGLLSVGNTDEPPANTPFPDYYGLQIVRKVVGPFDRIVAASSDHDLVQAFAVRKWDGSVAVLLVNTAPSTTYSVSISGVTGGFDNAPIYTYGETSASVGVSHAHGNNITTQTIAPYSLTAVVFHA